MDKKIIIILSVVLVLAVGFLIFSITFYFSKRSPTIVEQPGVIRGENGEITTPVEVGELSENYKDIFYQARKAMNPTICTLLLNTREKNECQDRINLVIALDKGDMNLCRAISDSNLRDQCFITIGQENNVNYCDHLSTTDIREECKQARSTALIIENQDIEACLDLAEEDQRACVFAIIYNFASIEGCAQIINQEYRTLCENYYQ